MKITSMTVENFLSFGKTAVSFNKQGLVLVEGENLDDDSAHSNGSGKSAMIDALVWCLFGTTLRGYENDEVVHRKVGEDCLVMVNLEDGDELYTVSRARRHSKLKNTLQVSHDNLGEDMSKGSNAETQEVVEKLLGCSKRTFLSSVVFGQDRAYRFSSLTDKEQKDILDEVLGVERFAHACAAARANKSMLDAEVDKTRYDLTTAEETIVDVERELKTMRKKDEDFGDELAQELKVERFKFDKAKEQLGKLGKTNTKKLKKDVERLIKEVDAADAEVERSNSADTEAQFAMRDMETKVADLTKHIERHEKLTGTCPTCSQEIRGQTKAQVLADYRKQLAAAKKNLAMLVKHADGVTERNTAAKKKRNDARAAVTAAQKVLNEAVSDEASIAAVKMRIADHQERIEKLETKENPYTDLIKRMEKRLGQHQKSAELLRTTLKEEEAKLKLADFWVNGFGARGLRSLLLDGSLPLLNNEAARISRAVTGGAIDVEFSATSDLKNGKTVDKFEVKVDNKHGAGTYRGNSAGERAKVDLCVGLALQRLVASRSSASFNLVFMDEVFDHLDSAAHERVVEVLSEIDKESVFVVSHDEDLKAWFPATLRVTKQDGFSTIE